MIQAEGLVKDFGDLRAVDELSFHVDEGECLGFLGPNGAGKTTTIKMLSGQAPMDAGWIEVAGCRVDRDPRAVKKLLGICPQEDNLDTDFNLEENLHLHGSYYGMSRQRTAARTEELLRFVQLWERRRSQVMALSGGMKRRLLLARSLVNEPRILILDEPTTGLDPQARHQVWGAVDNLKEQGITILLTTHYMDEAQRLCDRLLIVDEGKTVAEGAPEKMIRDTVGEHVVEAWGEAAALPAIVEGFAGTYEIVGRRIYAFASGSEDVRALSERADSLPGVERVIHRPATLEDVFLRLTGRELRE